jgi:hypothetical protein
VTDDCCSHGHFAEIMLHSLLVIVVFLRKFSETKKF